VSTATAGSSAYVPATTDAGGGDRGTNAPVKTLAQTQATSGIIEQGKGLLPVPGAGTGFGDGNAADLALFPTTAPTASTPGTGFGDDDTSVFPTVPPSSTPVNGEVATNAANEKIVPQPNRLDQYASSTWAASVYLLTTDQYKELLNSKKKSVNGYQLLFQSGGAPNNVGGPRGGPPAAGAADAGRNPFFPNDFYIESVTIDNKLPLQATRAAHLVTGLKFTVIEPLGITLLDRLYAAVQDVAPNDSSGAVNYAACQYLMVMRFYGYDENGKLISGASSSDANFENSAVIEKFIPFIISKMDWSVGSKLVQYDFEAAPVGQMIGQGVARGTIPYDMQISDSTVGKLLSGPPATQASVRAVDNAIEAAGASNPNPGASTSFATPAT
jgi:hypothetical protein